MLPVYRSQGRAAGRTPIGAAGTVISSGWGGDDGEAGSAGAGPESSGDRAAELLVEVAVPIPLSGPLVYTVPPSLRPRVRPGSRVRVRVQNRRHVGVVLGSRSEAPRGIEPRDIDGVLDDEPSITPEILALGRFVAEYYLAPIGETLAGLVPPGGTWGARRIALTDAGALGSTPDPADERIVAALRDRGPMRAGELQALLGDPDLPERLDRLAASGRARVRGLGDRARRYRPAYQLPSRSLEELVSAAGRSPKARRIVELLAAMERPAHKEEILDAVGCGSSPLDRLVKLGVVLRYTEPRRLDLRRHRLAPPTESRFELRSDQQRALEPVLEALAARTYAGFLLAGPTGAGKTEVYLRAIERVLADGRGALVLVPEIALVPALASAVRSRFGDRMAIVHSSMTHNERAQEWERIRSGQATVVLGARSAVFAPIARLGLVIVDEEQDPAYKQDRTPRYHGRDMALLRASREGAVGMVVSATPSLETRYNVATGKLVRLALEQRAGRAGAPAIELVDLRQEDVVRRPGEVVFTDRLRAALEATFAEGAQAILFRNRRGYAPLYVCRDCGEDHRCQACGLPRTYHRRDRRLVCHYCGESSPVPQRCGTCGEPHLEALGSGTERVEETFSSLFPGVVAAVLDRDAARRPGGVGAVLDRFGRGEAQALIGTQMVSKGHHFPEVALAVVLSADTYLGFPDFRAVERTYSLLTQLAGRAGRGDRPGRVIIQTFNPEHYAIQAAVLGDDEGFATEELRFRRTFHYPPYTRLVQILVQDRRAERAQDEMRRIATEIERHPLARSSVRVSGPAPAPLERLQDRWRFQLLLRSRSGSRLRALVRDVVPFDGRVTVDVDPHHLM